MRLPAEAGQLFLALLLALLVRLEGKADKECLERIRLPPGFSIASYADGRVPLGRSLALSKAKNRGKTVVYVSTRKDSLVRCMMDVLCCVGVWNWCCCAMGALEGGNVKC